MGGKARISPFQLGALAAAYMQSMAMTVGYCYAWSRQSTWLVLAAGFAVGCLMAALYCALFRRHPGKTLAGINSAVFGGAGIAVSIVCSLVFLFIAANYIYYFSSFWLTFIMPRTPRWVLAASLTLLCAYAVGKGPEVLARSALVLGATVFLTTALLDLLLIRSMDPGYLLPVFDVTPREFIRSLSIMAAIPFGDLYALTAFLPLTAGERRLRPLLTALAVNLFQTMTVVLRNVCTLGPSLPIVTAASFSSARLIDMGGVLTRMDVLVAASMLTGIFVKTAVLFHAAVSTAADAAGLRSRNLILSFGAVLTAASLLIYPSALAQRDFSVRVWPLLSPVFALILPGVTLLCTVAGQASRKRAKKAPPTFR